MGSLSEDAKAVATSFFSMGKIRILVDPNSSNLNRVLENGLRDLLASDYLEKTTLDGIDCYTQKQDMSEFRRIPESV